MEPSINARNIEVTDRLRNYVKKKMDRLDRYMPDLAEVRVDLSEHNATNTNERQVAQITVRDAVGTILRAEERHADIFAAIDMVVDKLYHQINRYRGKSRMNRRDRAGISELAQSGMLAELEPLPIDNLEDEFEDQRIVREKSFPMQPMSSDEAIDQMELLGHDFFIFFNIEDEKVNVVYQ